MFLAPAPRAALNKPSGSKAIAQLRWYCCGRTALSARLEQPWHLGATLNSPTSSSPSAATCVSVRGYYFPRSGELTMLGIA